jgi:Cu+-exporting ATPase
MCCCSGSKPKEQSVKDVVCGMEINPEGAAGRSEYQGKTYYFCAPGCKRRFDANPQQYVK